MTSHAQAFIWKHETGLMRRKERGKKESRDERERERERERCKKNVIGDQQKQTNKMAYFYPLTLDVWVQMIPYGREGDTGCCDLKGEGDSFTAITHPPARLSPSASWPHKMTYYIPDLFVLLKFNIKQIFAWYCEKKRKVKFCHRIIKNVFSLHKMI